MTDPENAANPQAEAEGLAKKKREADRDRKRLSRANKRLAEQATSVRAEAQARARREAEEASAKAEQIRRERESLLAQELSPPVDFMSVGILEDGTDYGQWVLQNLDDYLVRFERDRNFEELYDLLTKLGVGRLVLQYFNIPLPTPDPVVNWVCPDGYIYQMPQSEKDDLIARNVKLYSPKQIDERVKNNFERQTQEQIQEKLRSAADRAERKRREHRELMRALEQQYVSARKAMKAQMLQPSAQPLVRSNA